MEHSLKKQLAALGYTPSSIKFLAMSHLHGDHSGNANDYSAATWIVQKAEREFMFGSNLPANIRPEEYAGLKTSESMVINGDHDVFGDGSVTLIATPGHTPGHQSLLLQLPKTGAVLLTGDLYHFPGERSFHSMPEREKSLGTPASREKVEALVSSRHAQLWIQHDSVNYAKLKRAPSFYD